jgi:hypothetical protein
MLAAPRTCDARRDFFLHARVVARRRTALVCRARTLTRDESATV